MTQHNIQYNFISTIYCREKLSNSPSPRLAATEDWDSSENGSKSGESSRFYDQSNLNNNDHLYKEEEELINIEDVEELKDSECYGNQESTEDEKWEQTFQTVKSVVQDPAYLRIHRRRQLDIAAKRRRQAVESEEERLQRLQREAEAKRKRRLNESPEKRQRRLALHAERMRKARRMNKEGGGAEPRGTVVRQYINNTYTTYTQPDPDEPNQVSYQPERVQLVSMPQHQQYHTQPVNQGYRGPNQQPTVITVPLPQQTMGNGPVTIHVTLPENLQGGQQQVLQLPQQILIPAQTGQPNQFVLANDQGYNNNQPMHVIRIQTQPQATQQPSHIIIQGQQGPVPSTSTAPRPMPTTSALPAPSTSTGPPVERVVPPRFKNLTDEQIARRRKANAERSRRRRAMETPEQRAERNRRTAERMRQRRAKIAEAKVPPPPPKIKTLSADRFEEIYRSVIGQTSEPKEEDEDKNHKLDHNIPDPKQNPGQGYHPYTTTQSVMNGHMIVNQQPELTHT
ncbi:unnamed protein product [Bursaphelenchus okinawaensis]|uniref:Uncharacterized protein n=1 Tax=Bursaphelenchus okinawaensis TaxID=465554 RepID=A0A811LPA6_9BILA|nr:unnamed protein product [Bursaphelenchus okinawaensis]CAG9124868.1 unnamed protein product [Bursaphelenchus okinawaensis]